MEKEENGYLKLKGRFTGVIVEWKDGKLKCEPNVKKKIKVYANMVKNRQAGLNIANVYFGSEAPLRYKWEAYATICGAIEDMNILDGGPIPLESKPGRIY